MTQSLSLMDISNATDTPWVEKKFSYPNTHLKVATVFSGIGALEYALRRLKLDHDIIFASDIDHFVKKSYFANYQISPSHWFDDVKNIDGKSFKGQVDLLMGGSPCQSFSMVGKRQGLEDVRGMLIYDFVRLIKDVAPKVFIFENVKGLLTHQKGETFKIIREIFDETGYQYEFKVLNSKNYGIPQNRERLFLVGFREKQDPFVFPSAIDLECKMMDFLQDFTDSKYFLKEKGIKFVTSSKNRKKRYTQINGEIALCQKANQQFNWHGDFVFELSDKIEFDEFLFDVNSVEEKYYLSDKVRHYVLSSGTKNFKTSHQGRIRKLTPRECLRLMGFDDRFKQVVSDTQMYRQAGNSMVVDVIIALLKQMDISRFGR